MRPRASLVLLGCALLLAGFIALVERRGAGTAEREARARRALRVDASAVEALEIESGALQVALARDSRGWRLTRPVSARADRVAVERLLDGLEQLGRSQAITARERRERGLGLADYGLEPPRARLRVRQRNRERAYLVGAEAPLRSGVYVMEEGGQAVVAAGTNLVALLPADAAALRDRTLLPAEATRVRRIELRRPDGFVQLAAGEGAEWTLRQPVVARADPSAVQALVEALFAARIEAFIRDGEVDPGSYGFDEAATEISLTSEGVAAGSLSLMFGRPVEDRPGTVHAAFRRGNSVVAVPAALRDVALLPVDQLRDRRVVPLDPAAVTAFEVHAGAQALRLVRDRAGWRIAEPAPARADEERVTAWLKEWTGLRTERFHDGGASNLAAWGLAPPAGRVRFEGMAAATGAGGVSAATNAWTVLLGGESPGGRRFVRVESEPAVCEVSGSVPFRIAADPLEFRDREVLRFDPAEVRELSVVWREGVAQKVTVGPAGLAAADVSGATVDETTVRQQIALLSRLRAREWVAADPRDGPRHGFDDPLATIRVVLSGESGLAQTLLLGARTERGMYALVRGQDLVFLLEPTRAEFLLRRLWTDTPAADGVPPRGTGAP